MYVKPGYSLILPDFGTGNPKKGPNLGLRWPENGPNFQFSEMVIGSPENNINVEHNI
jgi:hypothetical protein